MEPGAAVVVFAVAFAAGCLFTLFCKPFKSKRIQYLAANIRGRKVRLVSFDGGKRWYQFAWNKNGFHIFTELGEGVEAVVAQKINGYCQQNTPRKRDDLY
jgi:hypothetical protein